MAGSAALFWRACRAVLPLLQCQRSADGRSSPELLCWARIQRQYACSVPPRRPSRTTMAACSRCRSMTAQSA